MVDHAIKAAELQAWSVKGVVELLPLHKKLNDAFGTITRSSSMVQFDIVGVCVFSIIEGALLTFV